MNTKSKILFFTLLLVVSGILTPSRKISALISVDSNGNVVYGSVLGDDDEHEDEKEDEEDDKNEEDKEDEEDKKDDEKDDDNEDSKDDNEDDSSNDDNRDRQRYEYQYEIKDDGRVEYQYESEDGDNKSKVKIKTNVTTSPTTLSRLRELRLQSDNGRIRVESEDDQGQVGVDSETEIEVEEGQNKSKVKIKSEANNQFRIEKDGTSALSRFPLTINLDTNGLIVNTASGQKIVTVLPDEAVKNLLRLNIVDTVETDATTTQPSVDVLPTEPTSGVNSVDESLDTNESIEIEEEDGNLVYKIKGRSRQKLLGFYPVEIEKEATVDTITGEVVQVKTSIIDNILDLISF